MPAYYNEIDPYAAQWLRNLITAGHIASGDVDERSIIDVRSDDLRGYTQCHFFAGIGVWSYALRLAGWSDDRSVWTGSCPCQPFSTAGKRKGQADARHLWPEWLRLIGESRPSTIFGEQVDDAIGADWLDDVFVSLEALDYACGAVDFPACSVGAPHIRQRVYFVADAERSERRSHVELRADRQHEIEVGPQSASRLGECGESDELAYANGIGSSPREQGCARLGYREAVESDCGIDELGHANDARSQGWSERAGTSSDQRATRPASAVNGFWRDAIWLPCRDGKARAIKPGIEPLVDGAPARVGRLRAYGNCIVAPQAQVFIESYLSYRG